MKTLACLATLALFTGSAAAQDHPWIGNPGSIWGQGGDLPGCTLPFGLSDANGALPGRHCRQNCCATHDKCYHDNGCTAKSWGKTFGDQDTLSLWLTSSALAAGDALLAAVWPLIFGSPAPTDADNGPACQACNTAVEDCFATALLGGCTDPGSCGTTSGKENCYDRACPAGQAYYCASDCYNPFQDVCEQQAGDARCSAAIALGYGTGATRYGMHGGAALNCVPWCYNGASGSGRLNNPGLTLCAADYDETNHAAKAEGFISAVAGGSLCCYCGASGLPSEDPNWPFERITPCDGAEGGHGTLAGCPTGCPCPPGGTCYNINGCWNDSHMCAQAPCGQAVGMCCG
jgi:hypothetical protein